MATGQDWTNDGGPELRACAEALLLLLYGRPPRVDELAGPGAARVLARL